MSTSDLIIFKGKNIRRHWDKKLEKWYFSVVDVIETLTDSLNPTDYLKKLRKRDQNLGSYIGTNCHHLKMIASDGKSIKLMLLILKFYLD